MLALSLRRAELVQISGATHAIETLGAGSILALNFVIPPTTCFELMLGSRYLPGKMLKGEITNYCGLCFNKRFETQWPIPLHLGE